MIKRWLNSKPNILLLDKLAAAIQPLTLFICVQVSHGDGRLNEGRGYKAKETLLCSSNSELLDSKL